MPRTLCLALTAALLLAACSNTGAPPDVPTAPSPAPSTAPAATPTAPPTATPAPTPAPSGVYEPAACRFEIPPGAAVECGYLGVPERHALPGGPRIRLHVAVFKSRAVHPAPDPVVYLEGGPGGDALKSLALGFERRVAPFLEERDFIAFDQRGAGFSEPSLDCPELSQLGYDLLDDDIRIAESTERYSSTALACRERLGRQGIDFGAYNSLESAADVEALRAALGYEQWNLYGISYGTRLALTTMRSYPSGIRSVILDSTVPPQSSETETPANIARAFATLWAGCDADARCRAAYPDLERAFYALVERLNAAPVTQPVTDPLSGKRYDLLLNGDSLFGVLTQALYSSELIPLLPLAIYAAAQSDDYGLLARLAIISTVSGEFLSEGMLYSVRCNEEIPFVDPQALAAADDAFPQLGGAFDQGSYTPVCAAWGAGQAPAAENRPVTSNLPALVLAGEYDPATPPDDGRLAAATLGNSFFFEFPGSGHGVSADGGCALEIALAFLRDPRGEPDGSCIAEMGGPAFVVPGASISLEPFTAADAGISGVRPAGWSEQELGVYTRPGGDVALKQARVAAPPEAVVQSVLGGFGLSDAARGTLYEANGREWSIYRLDDVGGYPVEIGVASEGDATLIVILASSAAEREALYEQVFLPALNAFEPLG